MIASSTTARRTAVGRPRPAAHGTGADRSRCQSAPMTSLRVEANSAKAKTGSRHVYSPVSAGMPAIFAYPRPSGIATAASVSTRHEIPCSASRAGTARSRCPAPARNATAPEFSPSADSPPRALLRSHTAGRPGRLTGVTQIPGNAGQLTLGATVTQPLRLPPDHSRGHAVRAASGTCATLRRAHLRVGSTPWLARS